MSNKYNLSNDFGIGYSTNTNEEFYFDLEDYDKINYGSWAFVKKDTTSYLINNKDKKYFHRLILNAKKGEVVDHINHNTLDNKKENLRICTNQENAFNSRLSKRNKSGIKGVAYNEKEKLWYGCITYNSKQYRKCGKNKFDIVKWRLNLELELFKDFSSQKHLFKEYGIGVENNE